MDLETVHHLEVKFRERFEGEPTLQTQALSDRIRRSLSWLKKAAKSERDVPSEFIALWIALNAMYGQRRYGHEREDPRHEVDDFRDFVDRLLRPSESRRAVECLLRDLKDDIQELVSNRHLWNEFWAGQLDFERKRRRAVGAVTRAVALGQAKACFEFLLPRLLVLRNQVLHGSASENARKNADSLRPALRLLRRMVAVFLRKMLDESETTEWPLLPYPGAGTPGYPSQGLR